MEKNHPQSDFQKPEESLDFDSISSEKSGSFKMCKNYEDIGILKHLTEICRSIDIFEVRVKAFPDKLRAVKITERQDLHVFFW